MEYQDAAAADQARYIFATSKLIHDRIIKIQSRCLAACEAGVICDLSVTQLHVVKTVRGCGEVGMSELAELMGVSPPSASAMVDRLVEKGVLCREHSAADRRKVVVRISPDAVKAADAFEASILQLFIELVQKIGHENAQKWCDALDSVQRVLNGDFTF